MTSPPSDTPAARDICGLQLWHRSRQERRGFTIGRCARVWTRQCVVRRRQQVRVRGETIVATTAPLPVNAPTNLGPAGISQFPLPITAAEHLALIDEQWAVVIRHPPSDDRRLDLHTLPLPLFFDRADQIVEMNWPGGPDTFHYHSAATKQ
jgi:hypothetical protein